MRGFFNPNRSSFVANPNTTRAGNSNGVIAHPVAKDAFGNIAAKQHVTFATRNANMLLTPSASATDSNGRASLKAFSSMQQTAELLARSGGNTLRTPAVFLPHCKAHHMPGLAQLPNNVGSAPRAARIVDVNNDGRNDIAVFSLNSNTLGAFSNIGNSLFNGPITIATGAAPYHLAAADFNADGAMDLAIVNRGGNSISLMQGANNDSFTLQNTPATGSQPVFVALTE